MQLVRKKPYCADLSEVGCTEVRAIDLFSPFSPEPTLREKKIKRLFKDQQLQKQQNKVNNKNANNNSNNQQ